MNYNLQMEDIIKDLNGGEKLLIHSCCGPCSSAVLERLVEYFDIEIYFYNPNIDTKNEYNNRIKEQKKILKSFPQVKLKIVNYDNGDFYKSIEGFETEPEGGERCFNCYKLRLENTARYGVEKGFNYFTTTLSISPHKNHVWINQLGEMIEKDLDIKFLYSDFKKRDGYKRSIELSKEYNLDRQDYCGCIFSKKERDKRLKRMKDQTSK